MHLAVVVNLQTRRARAMAQRSAERLGVPVDAVSVHVPRSAIETERTIAELVSAGPDAIIVSGGDGTVCAALQSMAGTGVAFGILPDGTGNDIASAMHAAAADDIVTALRTGRIRAVDVGRVTAADGTTRLFGSVLATGFDSLVNDTANRLRLLRGRARYNTAIVIEYLRLRRIDFRVTWVEHNGERGAFTGPLMMATVANTARYGGGIPIAPHAVDDDGLLDLVLIHPASRLRLLGVLIRVLRGRHLGTGGVETYRVREVTIDADRIRAYADGDPVGDLPLTATAWHGALQLLSRD